jgi:phosphate starvation-inducible PhoH-like protein
MRKPRVQSTKNKAKSEAITPYVHKGITPRNETQREYQKAIKQYDIVFGIGPAGVGKSLLAVSAAVTAYNNKQCSKIILVRPAIEAGEKLGFLPGGLQDKIDPYMRPLYDALHLFLGVAKTNSLIKDGLIEVAALGYMRGRTLGGAFIILDEAQNTTCEQMKMFLTRMGDGSKMVITGDLTQIDLPKNTKSGLVEALEILENAKTSVICEFSSDDIVRHPAVQEIVELYEAHKNK